ncbi:MAG: hypothetical protein FVQ81_06860 [Candidatus Glassbacteria bacterium]|nr:hypothetical protein [Candidatus Glassbacteria bacterium]
MDDLAFEQIKESFEYDKELPLEPLVYDNWPWRGPQVEYDEQHFLPPEKYNSEILQWLELYL